MGQSRRPPRRERGENVRRRGDFRKSRDFRLRASAKNDCNEKSERGGTIEIRERVAKKRGEVDFADDDEDEEKTEKKKKKKKKKKKNKKSTPGEQESLEAIAKRLAKQEIKDQNHENEDDSDVFGRALRATPQSSGRIQRHQIRSDVDEKEAKKRRRDTMRS